MYRKHIVRTTVIKNHGGQSPSDVSVFRHLNSITRDIQRVKTNLNTTMNMHMNMTMMCDNEHEQRPREDVELREFEDTKKSYSDLSFEWLMANEDYSKQTFLSAEMVNRRYELIFFNEFLSMQERQFHHLTKQLGLFRERIQLKTIAKRKSLSMHELLALTFHFLITGKVPNPSTYCLDILEDALLDILCDVCYALYDALKIRILQMPENEKRWTSVQNEFQRCFQLPECLGIISMRQIVLGEPLVGADKTKQETLVLTAIIDARCNFMFAEANVYSCHPYYFFKNSNLREHIESDTIKVPGCHVSNCVFHYFIGHPVMPVKSYLLTSYVDASEEQKAQRYSRTPTYIQEMRFCASVDRALLVEAKTFAALTNMFPILEHLDSKINALNARKIILCCIALYNYFRKHRTEPQATTTAKSSDTPGAPDGQVSKDMDDSQQRSDESITRRSCFQMVPYQVGNTALGNAKRDSVMERF